LDGKVGGRCGEQKGEDEVEVEESREAKEKIKAEGEERPN
jgi:hypothetical protein